MNHLLPWVIIVGACAVALAVGLYRSQTRAAILQQELDAREFRRMASYPKPYQRRSPLEPEPETELIREGEEKAHIRRAMARRGQVPLFDKRPGRRA